MSEKTFRVVLVLVAVIWVIFVLVPSAADALPRAWGAIRYILPGDRPEVVIVVKDARLGSGISEARVQIILDGTVLTAVSDEDGQAIFEAVPAGRARQIRVQKVDYDLGSIVQPVIPHRQRARFNVTITHNPDRRLYIGHDLSSGGIGVSMLDTASRLPLTPAGEAGSWENLPALDMQVNYATQRVYVLTTDSIIAIRMYDGAIIRQIKLDPPVAGMTISPDGDAVFVLVGDERGRSRWLIGIDARSWFARFSMEVATSAAKAALAASPDGRHLFLAPFGDRIIADYDPRTGRRQSLHWLDDPVKDIVLSRDGRFLYVLTEGRPVPLALDPSRAGSPTPVLDRLPGGDMSRATRLLYTDFLLSRWLCLLMPAEDSIALIDLNSREAHIVRVGQEPTAFVAVTYDELVFVASKGSNSLSVVSLTQRAVVDTVDVRSRPVLLALP